MVSIQTMAIKRRKLLKVLVEKKIDASLSTAHIEEF